MLMKLIPGQLRHQLLSLPHKPQKHVAQVKMTTSSVPKKSGSVFFGFVYAINDYFIFNFELFHFWETALLCLLLFLTFFKA